MSDLVFVQPDPIEQERRRAVIATRVRELLTELERTGATRGEILFTATEAPPFGGKLVIDLEPGPKLAASDSGRVTLTSRGER
jgi:hypothetical protein